MGLAARVVADGFNYDIQQRAVPKLDPATGMPITGIDATNGEPTTEVVMTRVLVVTDGVSAVEIVFTEDDWPVFQQRVADSRITIAAKLPPGLVVPNGHH